MFTTSKCNRKVTQVVIASYIYTLYYISFILYYISNILLYISESLMLYFANLGEPLLFIFTVCISDSDQLLRR